jgi:enolase
VDKAGHTGRFAYGLDCAATHFYDASTGSYQLAGQTLTPDELRALYLELIADFGIVTIEDPFAEDDFDSFAALTAESGIQIVGDDLFVTNVRRLQAGIDAGAANALLWKFNQIGTLTEAVDAAALATASGYGVCVSERSGETEDPVIADLVVALNAGQIKTGAPVRGERTSKYNRLLQIEEELGSAARYPGAAFPRVASSRVS